MALELVLITGMSGSGKSVALHALEDAGYYCVDNLPPELLVSFAQLEHGQHANRVALAIDVRSATALPLVPQQLDQLRASGVKVQVLFLDARTETLVRRFSETRRRHPLSTEELRDGRQALVQSIELERELLAELREQSLVIDTSNLRNADLLAYVKKLMAVPPGRLTLVFQSFAFKHGVPMDADYVFDVRMLPNPYYDPGLRPLTGRDKPVIDFLHRQPEVARMQADITHFLERWLPPLASNHRNYVTVAIGCTGGQHRSVYLVEQLAEHFASAWTTLKRHREQDGV
ncbi:MAG: RNase adaptor protein RapZ [Comamonas sp. SCN 67-35]|uniref:RNase adapter RapZ n=1 Tax=unclassified Comamonas TaxID=2638500 RepID=UPI00086F03ED|nr:MULTISPECIES: RNase adapter RapZ [unclassified Comamonas]MBN9329308.1 RNase adapter RapZ [Comamonas sp.]ODU38872.1 MAG: RNase adaptor protein RapZ [Comamonas sp. SCN 67-35]OJX02603.1 MAG: RNase adaptor protein RapZ [Burkholderiales bacterium 66-26]